MIAHVHGEIVEKFANSVILDIHGVGYEVILSTLDYSETELNTKHKFYTFHAIKENSEELYGFSTLAAKRLFELLLSVNGVGPKAALSILSLAPAEVIRNAIANSDSAFIGKASGVGKKSSERIIIDLKDKVGLPSSLTTPQPSSTPAATSAPDEALDALIALGFSLKEASEALAQVDPTLSVSERVRLALKN